MKPTGLTVLLLLATVPARSEWSLAAYAGGTRTHSSSIDFTRAGSEADFRLEDVSFESRSFDSPIYYGYRAGYFFNDWFGVEAELIHAKVHAETEREVRIAGTVDGEPIERTAPMEDYVSRFDISHGVNLLLANAVFRRALGADADSSWLVLTGRVGMGSSVPHPETTVLGESQEQYEVGGLSLQAAAGVEVRLWRGLFALAEYKFTHAKMDLQIAGGAAMTTLDTHHGVAGLGVRF